MGHVGSLVSQPDECVDSDVKKMLGLTELGIRVSTGDGDVVGIVYGGVVITATDDGDIEKGEIGSNERRGKLNW